MEAMDGFYCRPERPCSAEGFETLTPGPGCLYECPGHPLVNISIFGRDSEPPRYVLHIHRVREDGASPGTGGTGAEGVTLARGTQYGTGATKSLLITFASGAP